MKMMRRFLVLIWFSVGASFCFAEKEARVITVTDLKKNKVIGELGLPLGTVTQIEVEIVSGNQTRRKEYAGQYVVKVISVGGKVLEEPPVMEFAPLRTGDPKIATTAFELYELKYGKKASLLETAEILELEKGYVGKKTKLIVYESGGFSGAPSGLPDGVVWQDEGYGFSTSLVVVKID